MAAVQRGRLGELVSARAGIDDDAHRPSGYGGGYLINQSNAAVQLVLPVLRRANYDGEDGLMMDDQSAGLTSQLYYATCGCSSSEEIGSTSALLAAHESMSAAMTHSDGQPFLQIDNTLPPNPYLPQGFGMLDQATGVEGLISEGAPEYNGTLDPFYSTLLDRSRTWPTRPAGSWCRCPTAPAGASYQQQSRRVQEATMLLGYSPGHLVDWADLEQGSGNLAVWPEEGIYPTSPVQSMGRPAARVAWPATGGCARPAVTTICRCARRLPPRVRGLL